MNGGLAVETQRGGGAGAPAQPFQVAEGEPRRVPGADSGGARREQDPLANEIQIGFVVTGP